MARRHSAIRLAELAEFETSMTAANDLAVRRVLEEATARKACFDNVGVGGPSACSLAGRLRWAQVAAPAQPKL